MGCKDLQFQSMNLRQHKQFVSSEQKLASELYEFQSSVLCKERKLCKEQFFAHEQFRKLYEYQSFAPGKECKLCMEQSSGP